MLGFLKTKLNLQLYFLILLNVLVHYRVFLPGYSNAGDWIHVYNGLLSELYLLNIWVNHTNIGWSNILLNNIYFYWLNSIVFNTLSIDWNNFTKFFFIAPAIFFTPITAYLFFNKILKNNISVFSATLFYLFNTFHLKLYLDWITYLYCWWVFPLILFLIIRYFETRKFKYWYPLIFLFFLIVTVELRVALVIIIFSILFAFYISYNQSNILSTFVFLGKILGLVFLGISLHASWLIPIFLSERSHVDAYASSSVFRSFYTLFDLFSLRFYGWQNSNLLAEVFEKVTNDYRSFIVSSIVIFGIYFSYLKDKKNYLFYFFSLLFLLLLSKQNNLPFTNLYTWLFENLPLFNLYRESSKFFIILAIPLSYFFGIGVESLNFSILKYNLTKFTLLFILLIFNTQHYITGKIGGMATTISIPNDYLLIKEYIASENNYYRTVWFPINQRWDYASMQNPAMAYTFIRDYMVNGSKDCNFYLDNLSIKYLIFQEKFPSSPDNPFILGTKDKFINEIKDCSLEPVNLGLEKLEIYKNVGHAPHFYLNDASEFYFSSKSTPVLSSFLSPTHYEITINNLDKEVNLVFTEKYDNNWAIRVGDFFWYQSLVDDKYFLEKSGHFKNELNLNIFKLNPSEICNYYNCEKNPDGSVKIKINVINKMSSLFYLGASISLAVFLFLFCYLLKHLYYLWVNNRR